MSKLIKIDGLKNIEVKTIQNKDITNCNKSNIYKVKFKDNRRMISRKHYYSCVIYSEIYYYELNKINLNINQEKQLRVLI